MRFRSRMSLVLLLLVAAPAGLAAPANTASFIYHEGLIFLDGRVNGAPALCLIDTGANVSAMDEQIASRLALPGLGPTQVLGTTGSVTAEMVRIDTLEIGGKTVRDLTVTRRPVQHGATPGGQRLDLIVGFDFLKHFVVAVDFDRRTLALGPEPTPRHHWVGMNLDEGIPVIDVSLDGGYATRLRIDSGSSLFKSPRVFLNLTRRDEQQLRTRQPERTAIGSVSATGVGGTVSLPVYQLSELRVGPVHVSKPRAIIQSEQGYFARPDAVGFCGNNFLEKYSPVCFDYPNARLGLTLPAPETQPASMQPRPQG